MKTKQLKSILQDLKKDELINLILKLNNTPVNKSFFDEQFQSLTYNNMFKMIDQRIDHYSTHGYVKAKDARHVFKGFDNLIKTILKENDPVKQINLFVQLLAIGSNLQGVDDSYGGLQQTQTEVLQNIIILLNENELSFKEEEKMRILKNAFLYHSQDNLLGIDDWRNDLFIQLIDLCNTNKLYQYFHEQLTLIEAIIDEDTESSYSNFRKEALLQVKFLLLYSNDIVQAKQFVFDHLHYGAFKILHLDLLARDEAYEELLATTEEYVKERYINHKKILSYRLLASQKLHQQAIIRNTARLLLDLREFEYYDVYKNTFNQSEYDKMIQDLIHHDNAELRHFVIIKENLQERMVQEINHQPTQLRYYYDYLSSDSFSKIKNAYQSLILMQANQANKRSKYRRVCKLIKAYQQDYQTQAIDIIETLQNEYPRKTAFLDELHKIKPNNAKTT